MDALSSMATVAGYKGVLLAADALPRMFPMLMTAAGTISPARVFVVGAGVAGLQAISSARRLGAKVEAYDVRPAVKEQVQSLGAKFVELPLESADAEDKGRIRQSAGRILLSPSAGDDDQGRRRQRRGHHHGADSWQAGADSDHDGDGGRDAARIGDRRSGGGARRQLRGDPARRTRRPSRRHRARPDEPGRARPLPREPDVLEEHHHLPAAPARQGRREAAEAADRCRPTKSPERRC